MLIKLTILLQVLLNRSFKERFWQVQIIHSCNFKIRRCQQLFDPLALAVAGYWLLRFLAIAKQLVVPKLAQHQCQPVRKQLIHMFGTRYQQDPPSPHLTIKTTHFLCTVNCHFEEDETLKDFGLGHNLLEITHHLIQVLQANFWGHCCPLIALTVLLYHSV